MRPAQWVVTLLSDLQPQAQMSITHLGECWRSSAHWPLSCREHMMAAGGEEAEHTLLLQRWQPGTSREAEYWPGHTYAVQRSTCSSRLL